jgi:hypothetical protein
MEPDKVYFSRRAAEERSAAANTAHQSARQAHLELAHRYDDLARAIIRREYYLGLDLFEEAAAA